MDENLNNNEERPKNGGARDGSGRPHGSKTYKNREIVSIAMQNGVTPIEVMIDNMRFAHGCAMDMYNRILDFMAKQEANPTDETADLKASFQMFLNLKDRAQAYAKDAAPYMHPRLASIEITEKEPTPPIKVDKIETPADGLNLFMQMRKFGQRVDFVNDKEPIDTEPVG